MQLAANSVQLIKGGNVIKMGDETPFTFQLNDESGEPVDLTGASVLVRLANYKVILLTKEATINDDNTITFSISSEETVGHGQMRLEFVVTHADGKKEIFPAQGYQEIYITPSLGSLDSGTVAVITIDEFERRVNAAVDEAYTQADRAKAEADRLEGTDVSQLDLRIDGLTSQLAQKAQQSDLDSTNEELSLAVMQLLEKVNYTELEALQDEIANIIAQSGTSDTEVVNARQDIDGDSYATLAQRLNNNQYDARLIASEIKGTEQRVTFVDGVPSTVYHIRTSDNVNVRLDKFTFGENTIVEERTLHTGAKLTLTTDLTTLKTVVS